MRYGRLTVFTLVVLSLIHVVIAIPATSQLQIFEVINVVWGSTTSPSEVGPGDTSQLVIVLRTLRTIPSQTITAYLDLPRGITSLTGESRVVTYYRSGGTSIPAGSVIELQFRVKIRDDCKLGRYVAKLTLEYVTEVLYYSGVYSEELYVNVFITGKPDIRVSLNDVETYPGNNTISFIVLNEGSAIADNVTLELTTSPSIYVNVSKISLGSLSPNTYVTVPITAYINPVLTDSTIIITATATYYGPLGNLHSEIFKFTMYVRRYVKPLIEVSLGNNELVSASSINTYLMISNIGVTEVNDVVIRLSTQHPLMLGNISTYSIGSIRPGESISIPLKLNSIPVSTTTLALLTVTIEYTDPYGGSSSRSVNLPVVVRALRDPALVVRLITNEVVGGEESSLEFILSNIGPTDLRNITLQLTLPQGIIALTPTQAMLSSIDVNSTTYVGFKVIPSYTETLQYFKVGLQVGYYDAYGNYFSSVYDFTVAIRPKTMYNPLIVELQPRTFKVLNTGKLYIRITSNEDLSNVRVSISTTATPLVVSSDDVLVGSVRAGESYVIELPYIVMNKPGTYVITSNIRYVDRYGISRTSTQSYVINVVPTSLAIRVDVIPKNISSGSSEVLQVKVFNVGDEVVRDLTLSVSIQGAAITMLNESGKYYIGVLEPGSSKELKIYVRSNYVTSYTIVPLVTTLTYYDVLNQQYSETHTINIGVEPRASTANLAVEVSTNELIIGKVNYIGVRIRNIGYGVIEGLTYKVIANPPLSLVGVNEGFIGSLREGDYVNITLSTYVAITTQYSSSMTIVLSYLDKALGVVRSEDKVITFVLRGIADIRVTDYVVVPSTVAPGQTFTISLTLINVGVTPAYTVFVTPMISGLPLRALTEERSIYLGNIDVGSTSVATITLQFLNVTALPINASEVPRMRMNVSTVGNVTTSNIPAVIRLPILITFLDNLRTPHNVTTEVNIRVGTQVSTPLTTTQYSITHQPLLPYIFVVLVIVAIIALIIWRYLRGRS